MPPIKGRMLGLQPTTPIYRAAKSISSSSEKKPRDFAQGAYYGLIESAEKLKRLRIPDKICRNLPSAKSFSEAEPNSTSHFAPDDADVKGPPGLIRRTKSICGKPLRCQLIAEREKRFPGIIWDVCFLSNGDIVVCYGDGIVICDRCLEVKTTLDQIKLAGGAAVTTDGNIVAVDRFNDTVNIYTTEGKYISSFPGGSSPMNIAVNRDNFLIVTDVGDKCVRIFSIEGTLLNTISTKGQGYEFQWPLYVLTTADNTLVVSDVLQRKVFSFDEHGSFIKELQLKTYGANCVLRPHGICLGQSEDFFIVDNALDTVEIFRLDDCYVQTVLPSEEGAGVKPKVLRMSDDGYVVIGGMTGAVKLFKFVNINKDLPSVKLEQGTSDNMKCEAIKQDSFDVKNDENSAESKDCVASETNYKTDYTANDCIIIID